MLPAFALALVCCTPAVLVKCVRGFVPTRVRRETLLATVMASGCELLFVLLAIRLILLYISMVSTTQRTPKSVQLAEFRIK